MQRRVLLSPTKRFNTLSVSSRRQALRSTKDSALSYDEFKTDVTLLRSNANIKIPDVIHNQPLSTALNRVRDLLLTMSGDESYAELIKIVEASFADLANPIPYTIGAQFRGWNIKTNMDGTDFEPCVAVRIGSLQKPGYINRCKYVSMYADWTNDKFMFTNDIIDRSTDKRPLNQVVVNVPFTSVNAFPGFSNEEKEELKRNEITEVCVIGFRAGSNDYIHLTKGEFIPLENIKTRYTSISRISAKNAYVTDITGNRQIVEGKHQENETNNGFGAAAFIFFILIIIVIIMLFWFFWK